MPVIKIPGAKALRDIERQVFHLDLRDEEASQWHTLPETELLKIDFDSICQNQIGDVHGLSQVQRPGKSQVIRVLLTYQEPKDINISP